MSLLLAQIGRIIAHFLSQPLADSFKPGTNNPEKLAATLQKGDVLLIEGNTRFSMAIKYLTQSSWSHSALYIGDALGKPDTGQEARVLLEADINEGVRAVPLRQYAEFHTRICRPVGLSGEELNRIIAHVLSRLGQRYDLKNIADLMRYFVQHPPVPIRWRRRLLALGSGDPTRAICSSLIAEAFQSINYPILPEIEARLSSKPECKECYEEILHIRHHSLFVPRDFDVSPYFQIIKPTLEQGFDFHRLTWERESNCETAQGSPALVALEQQ